MIRASLFLLVTLLLAGCAAAQTLRVSLGDRSSTQPGVASLTATPDPVPVGAGSGTTTISWSTGDGSNGQVYVSESGGPESLFAQGPAGSQDAPWISAGVRYAFRLYAGTEHTILLTTVTVKRSAEPTAASILTTINLPREMAPPLFLVLLIPGAYNFIKGRSTTSRIARDDPARPTTGRSSVLPPGAQYKAASCAIRPAGTVQDALFLSLVVALSLILYIRGLGFYSDDWATLGIFSTSPDKSFIGLFQSHYILQLVQRPVEVLAHAGLYALFGPHPLGYHLANAAVLLLTILLFYLVLRELGQLRVLSLAVPAVYALLPHYSAERFWVGVFAPNLSMALYFLNLYSDSRWLRARRSGLYGWKLLAILSLLGSTLAYEVVLPLFLLNPLLVWFRRQQIAGSAPGKQLVRANLPALVASNLLLLTPVVVFKALTTIRIDNRNGPTGFVASVASIIRKAIALDYGDYDYGLNFKRAISLNYGDYGLGLPGVVWSILRDYPNETVLAAGGVFSLAIFGYLYRAACQSEAELPGRTAMLGFITWGQVVFVLGYAIFLTNDGVVFTATGIGSRTAIAAAVGVALSLVGGLGWVSTFLPSGRLRRSLFCLLVSALCTAGFLIDNTLASFWTAAYREEQAVLTEIAEQFPTLPVGTTLILDGVCPYIGPAMVFESDWDLAGALQMLYRNDTLQATIVAPGLKVTEDGLTASWHSAVERRYPYGNLFIYHFGRKMAYQLTDADSAHRYFQTLTPGFSYGCPEGRPEFGVRVF